MRPRGWTGQPLTLPDNHRSSGAHAERRVFKGPRVSAHDTYISVPNTLAGATVFIFDLKLMTLMHFKDLLFGFPKSF